MRRPVFGEDCRRSVKINLLFGDVFDAKRSKNLDRYTSESPQSLRDLDTAPSTVFNPCCPQDVQVRNLVEDWPESSQLEIEEAYTA